MSEWSFNYGYDDPRYKLVVEFRNIRNTLKGGTLMTLREDSILYSENDFEYKFKAGEDLTFIGLRTFGKVDMRRPRNFDGEIRAEFKTINGLTVFMFATTANEICWQFKRPSWHKEEEQRLIGGLCKDFARS